MCPDLAGGHRFGVATIANTPLSKVQNQQGIWGCTRECRLEVSHCFDHMITIVQQQFALATVTQFHHVSFLQRRTVPTPEEKHLSEAQQIHFLIFCPWVTSDTQKEKHWHCQYFPKPRATNKNKPVGLPTMLLFLIICQIQDPNRHINSQVNMVKC